MRVDLIFRNLLLIAVLSLISHQVYAQPSNQFDNSLWLVFNSSNVEEENLERVDELMNSFFSPLIDGLLMEGKLISWGYLESNQNSETNHNLYFVSQDEFDFDMFWGEYSSLSAEKYPTEWKELHSYLKSNKNISHTNTLARFSVPQR